MEHRSGSTDMGDVSQLMPVIHPYVGAATGNAHGADYLVEDYDLGVLVAAKAMATTVVDLLADNARVAREIMTGYKPPLTKKEYLSLLRDMYREETFTE
jgi:metal-dependent amidase/aminoacylase/carboxypeptidase family protein